MVTGWRIMGEGYKKIWTDKTGVHRRRTKKFYPVMKDEYSS